MNAIAESLMPRLRPILVSFADTILGANPTLTYDLGGTENDAFLLRAYLSFRMHDDGDEVAVTVDVNTDADTLNVVSDVCGDDGLVIAVGPATTEPWRQGQPIPDDALRNWLTQFERFLRSNERVVVRAAAILS